LCVGDVKQDGEYDTTCHYFNVSPSFQSRPLESLSQRTPLTARDQRYAMDVDGFDAVNEQASSLRSVVNAPPQTQFLQNREKQHQSESSQGVGTHSQKPVYDTHNNLNAHAPAIKTKKRERPPCHLRPVVSLSSPSPTPPPARPRKTPYKPNVNTKQKSNVRNSKAMDPDAYGFTGSTSCEAQDEEWSTLSVSSRKKVKTKTYAPSILSPDIHSPLIYYIVAHQHDLE
jgi:hypothetical protein